MKFIIHNIKIWFNSKESPKRLHFFPNRVNVITGDSRTGKSNILAIIDYCLLSNINNIIDDIINQSAKWYSIDVTINNKNFFIARHRALNGSSDSRVCILESNKNEVYPTSNTTLPEARDSINKAYKDSEDACLGDFTFRDSLPLNYLTEEVISSSNMYFDFVYLYSDKYEFSIYNFFSDLPNQIKELNIEIQKIKDTKIKHDRWKNQVAKKEEKFNTGLDRIVASACKAGILDSSIQELDISDKLNHLDKSLKLYRQVARNSCKLSEIPNLKKRYSRLISKRNAIERLNTEYDNYIANITKIKDSLLPIEIINKSSNHITRSFETGALINALEKSLMDIKRITNKECRLKFIDTTCIDTLNDDIEEVTLQIQNLQKTKNLITNYSDEIFTKVGELRAKLSSLKISRRGRKLTEPERPLNNFADNIIKLQDKLKDLESQKNSLLNALQNHIKFYLKEISSIGNYSKCFVSYNLNQNRIQLKNSETDFTATRVGSKSNEMFLHLCCYLGLHNASFDLNANKLLPFLFIDQPSIPYYSGENNFNSEDKDKLMEAFQLLDSFITHIQSKYACDFQIILIEHAPKSYWENILDNFKTIDTFTNGNKLIPQKYYHEQ